MTMDEVIRRLFDGLQKNEADWCLARKFLKEHAEKNDMTNEQLDDLCFEDSNWVFDRIYEEDVPLTVHITYNDGSNPFLCINCSKRTIDDHIKFNRRVNKHTIKEIMVTC